MSRRASGRREQRKHACVKGWSSGRDDQEVCCCFKGTECCCASLRHVHACGCDGGRGWHNARASRTCAMLRVVLFDWPCIRTPSTTPTPAHITPTHHQQCAPQTTLWNSFLFIGTQTTHFAPLKSASEQARAPTHTHAHERPHTHASANGGAHMSALPRACLRTADAGNNRCCDEQAGCTELPAWSGHAQSHTHTHPHTPAVPTSNALLAGTCRATFTSTFERTRPARASARQE
jgi:hypothetical protein